MRILLLTQYFPPELGAPQSRLSDLASRLSAMGHEISVLTALPNYPSGIVQGPYRGRLLVRDQWNGIPVTRVWLYTTQKSGSAPKLANYVSFTLTSLLTGLLDKTPVDLVLTESPPLFLGLTGIAIARRKRAAFVFNVADPWPRAAIERGIIKHPKLIAGATGLEEWIYHQAALVLTQSQSMRQDIALRSGHPHVLHFPSGVDVDKFSPRRADPDTLAELGLADRFVVGYAGLHGPGQGLDVILHAAASLTDLPDVCFALFGEGPDKERLQAAAAHLPNVKFFPPRPAASMPALTAAWSAAAVTLRCGTSFEMCVPSKLFEAMAAGVPVALAADGEAMSIVRKEGCGLAMRAGDAPGLAAAIRTLHGDPALASALGAAGRRATERTYDRQQIANTVAVALQEAQQRVS